MDSVASFAPKLMDHDCDIRYMAVSDLNTFLEKCEKGTCKVNTFMKSVADQKTVFDGLINLARVEKEGTVQEQVQRCFYYLCKNADIARDRCTDAINRLLGLIKDEAKSAEEAACNRREVASVALRESLKGISEVPASQDAAATFAPELFGIVRDNSCAADARVKSCECFTVIVQSSPKYVAANPNLVNDLFLLLAASTANSLSLFRKRLVTCIVSLSSQLSDETFSSFVKLLCEKLSEAASASTTPFGTASSIVQIIGAVAATPNGNRITNNLEDFITRFVILCKEPTNASMEDSDGFDDSNNEALDELRSLVFQSIEVLLGKCSPATLIPLLPPVLQLISKFISYNPNMFGEEEDDDDDDDSKMSDAPAGESDGAGGDGEPSMGADDEEDGFDDDFGSDFDDDDVNDSSWKIRRDAIRCFVALSSALIQSPVQFVESSKLVFSSLLKRLNDRDDSVLLEAISAVSSVVGSCSAVVKNYNSVKTKSIVEALNVLFSSALAFAAKVSRKLTKVLGEEKTSVKVRTCCVQLATALVAFDKEAYEKIQSDASKDYHKKFVQNILTVWSSVNKALSSSENCSTSSVSSGIPSDPAAATLKVESLRFFQAFLDASSAAVSSRQQSLESIPTVSKCMADPYVHSASEALRVVPFVMAALKKDGNVCAEDAAAVDSLAAAVVTKSGKLGNSNLELEVKECAINAVVSIVTVGGAVVPAATLKDKCLPVIMTSLQTESTRALGVKALNEIASSATKIDISSIAGSAVDMLTLLIRDSMNKQMRQSALAATATVFKHEAGSKSVSEAQIVNLMNEICTLISSEDLYVSHLVVDVAASALACSNTANVKKSFAERFMTPINKLISSQPVQGATLSSLVSCFDMCGKTGVFSAPLKIVEGFTGLVGGAGITKQIISSIAVICGAYINGIGDESTKKDCVKQLVALCKKPFSEENQSSQSFAMLTIGNVGRDCDLADMQKVIMGEIAEPAFAKGSDDVRSAAAFMLGSVTAGSISAYIKAIEDWAKGAQDTMQYYVLATLREFATKLVETNNTAGSAQVCSKVAEIVKALIHKEDEGKRNIAATCLGKLCALTPATVCPVVLAMASDASNKESRTIAAGAIRVMYSSVIGGKTCAAWQCENKPVIVRFIYDNARVLFGLISDAEVQVRHALLLTLNYLLHQNSSELIPDDVFSVLAPAVLHETEIRKELIEIVEYGPLKVRQDHGIEARKATYECLSALLDAYPDALKVEDVLAHVGKGMVDEYDVNLLAIQICCKIASSPLSSIALPPFVDSSLSASIDAIMFPQGNLKKKTPDELEHMEEAKRKVMRLVVLLKNIPGMSAAAPNFTKFVNTRIITAPALSAMMKEAEEAETSK